MTLYLITGAGVEVQRRSEAAHPTGDREWPLDLTLGPRRADRPIRCDDASGCALVPLSAASQSAQRTRPSPEPDAPRSGVSGVPERWRGADSPSPSWHPVAATRKGRSRLAGGQDRSHAQRSEHGEDQRLDGSEHGGHPFPSRREGVGDGRRLAVIYFWFLTGIRIQASKCTPGPVDNLGIISERGVLVPVTE